MGRNRRDSLQRDSTLHRPARIPDTVPLGSWWYRYAWQSERYKIQSNRNIDWGFDRRATSTQHSLIIIPHVSHSLSPRRHQSIVMLAASLLSLAVAASLSVASPLNRRQPTIRQAPGFSLVARVTGTPGPAFDTPVDHWRVIGGRIGAGLAAAVLNAEAGATFFVNGTAAEVAERRASVALPPMAVTGAGAVPG